jgi:hypothetical protein
MIRHKIKENKYEEKCYIAVRKTERRRSIGGHS